MKINGVRSFIGLILTVFLNQSIQAAGLCSSVYFSESKKVGESRALTEKKMILAAYPGKVAVQDALLDPVALKKIVRVFDASAYLQRNDLIRIPDGFYLYLIDSNYRVAIMDRAAVAADGSPLAEKGFVGTHEALHSVLERPRVLAAGEFSIRANRLIMMSNGSGTFRGQLSNLGFAHTILLHLGLRIEADTRVLDYSEEKIANPHQTATRQVEMEMKIRQSPEMQARRDEVRDVMRRLNNRSWQSLVDELRTIFKTDRNRAKAALQALAFIGQWKSPVESEAMVLAPYLEGRADLELVLAMLRSLPS